VRESRIIDSSVRDLDEWVHLSSDFYVFCQYAFYDFDAEYPERLGLEGSSFLEVADLQLHAALILRHGVPKLACHGILISLIRVELIVFDLN